MTTTPTRPQTLLARPGEPAYVEATATYNLAAPLHPAAAVVARSSADVVAAVRAAREAGLAVRSQTTGHGAGAQASLADTLLVRTAFDAPVRVDPAARTARVPAGTTWAAVVAAAEPYGLAALHGSSPTVGVVGYLLGGGLSFYGRRFGVAANHVRSITVVLADGREVETSAEVEPALFWALRGGGGGFGVVTEVEVELVEMNLVVTGGTFWDAADAAVVAPLWEAWTTTAPPEVATSLRLMNLPPLPGVPPVLVGRQVLVLDGAAQAPTVDDVERAQAVAHDLLDPLRSVATPLLDTWHPAPPSALTLTHLDPPDPMPYAGESALLRTLGAAGVAGFLEAAGPGSGTTIVAAELRQLGGAFGAPDRTGGAFDRTDAAFAYQGLGLATPETAEDLDRITTATAPWRTGFTAPSFVEGRRQQQRTSDDATVARVEAVRRAVDPDGVFAGGVAPVLDRPARA
ncbi:FAD-binding protein [Microlunatus flavus]|uniref:FAD/FMN-containing dehydrogenase n=1 Tax=Microlunatus flavus TaxID=1036181 RepID=A0A1H9BZZ6_9ACTN|nr:FAD-binding protein [Microlunatus flavus]SEP94424.1 FAD/FMN-containing dehydrogenase [Microlunatus flavus]